MAKDKGVRVFISNSGSVYDYHDSIMQKPDAPRLNGTAFTDTDLAELLKEERRKAFEAAREHSRDWAEGPWLSTYADFDDYERETK